MFVQRNKFFNFKSFEFLVPGLIGRKHAFLRYSLSENKDVFRANTFLELLTLKLLKVFLSGKHLSEDQLSGMVYRLQSITDVFFIF